MNPKDLVGAKKAPVGLVPPALMIGAAEALAVGADKYTPYNWRDYPVQAMTYVEAALRHLFAYWDGETFDPETGIMHVKHAVAGLAILLDCYENGTLVDNRPKPGPAAKMLADQNKTDALPYSVPAPHIIPDVDAIDYIKAVYNGEKVRNEPEESYTEYEGIDEWIARGD